MIDFFHESRAASNFCDDRKSALRTLSHPDAVVSNDNMWDCVYYNVSQLIGLRYSPVLNQKLV